LKGKLAEEGIAKRNGGKMTFELGREVEREIRTEVG
jgi:hypothetical protein